MLDAKSVTGSPCRNWVDFSGLLGRPKEQIAKTAEALCKNVVDTYNRGGITTVAWHFQIQPLRAALTETGLESISNPIWWTEILLKALKAEKMNLACVLVWRNDVKSTTHFYAPFPTQISVPDFLKFYDDPNTLFEKDLKHIYRKNDSYFFSIQSSISIINFTNHEKTILYYRSYFAVLFEHRRYFCSKSKAFI